MENFEYYAKRILDGLPAPDQISDDLIRSPLDDVIRDLEEGQLLKVQNIDREHIDFPDINGEAITEKEGKDVENGVLVSGLEALAIYKSIHYEQRPPFRGKWGIFIFDYALRYLVGELEVFYPNKFSLSERKNKSFKLLYFHERFHFRFDSWVISQESATKTPLYENYRNKIYRIYHPQKHVYEESLANLHALSCIAREGIAAYAKAFMLSQPGAYSNIVGVDRNDFRSKLAAQVYHGPGQFLGVPSLHLPEHNQYLANPANTKVTDSWCPVFVVQGILPSRFTTPGITLPSLKEMENGFIRKYLNGTELKATDHKFYKLDNGQKIKFPNPHRKNIKLNEFSNIIKKAGLTQKDFYKERLRTFIWGKNIPRPEVMPSLI
jgi:hypothetical protein